MQKTAGITEVTATMKATLSQNEINRFLDSLERIATALEKCTSPEAQSPAKLPPALAYRWHKDHHLFSRPRLVPVAAPQLIEFDKLRNIDQQIERIRHNTLQFVHRYPANNVLMTGARGTGKSSLVRACLHAFQEQGLRLIEVEKQHLNDLPEIIDCVRDRPERFIVFCDDLSFEDGEHHYKALKTVLDGSVAGPSANVLVYATSNRRHLVSERMSDNLDYRLQYRNDEREEIHPGDSVEEKVSLSERFGLCLHFYSFSQDEYLAAVSQWLENFGFTMNKDETMNGDEIRTEALRWATEHGSRSGRIAWQFARDYAGRSLARSAAAAANPNGAVTHTLEP